MEGWAAVQTLIDTWQATIRLETEVALLKVS
jgi:hypothetical protein